MKNYSCLTCQEPMKISIMFHAYIREHGPQVQKCMKCGALHDIDGQNNIRLKQPGKQMAKLSVEFPYPEYAPYRVGAYRVRFSTGAWSKAYINWDGDRFHNGPIQFSDGAIRSWQGLAGDMEHLKVMPYDHADPLPDVSDVEGD